jgi:hypothetical protein
MFSQLCLADEIMNSCDFRINIELSVADVYYSINLWYYMKIYEAAVRNDGGGNGLVEGVMLLCCHL